MAALTSTTAANSLNSWNLPASTILLLYNFVLPCMKNKNEQHLSTFFYITLFLCTQWKAINDYYFEKGCCTSVIFNVPLPLGNMKFSLLFSFSFFHVCLILFLPFISLHLLVVPSQVLSFCLRLLLLVLVFLLSWIPCRKSYSDKFRCCFLLKLCPIFPTENFTNATITGWVMIFYLCAGNDSHGVL